MLDTSAPNLARAYDYLLGGGANFAADRSLAGRLTALYPRAPELLSSSRTYRADSLADIAARGIRQYVDVGAGLPTRPSTHSVVRGARDAQVVYVDNDPAVVEHTSSLVPPGVRAVEGELAEPEALLDGLDLARPACLVLTMVLQVLDPGTARAVTGVLVRALAPGSHVVITVGAGEEGRLPDAVAPGGFTADDMAAFFAGLDLVPPGITQGPVLCATGIKRGG
ncbi:MAG TPA: SAM-dependent methyltransferase [Trebonia sp.]|nr:SAM-dependent methyltransferase [Trebonia sp.]